MAIPVSSCSVFIQIWVDVNALQNGQTRGVYLVDNNLNNGSSDEGTTSLCTNVPSNTSICWTVLNVDPNSTATLSIQNFSDSPVFGAGGVPQMVAANTWTGQVMATGTASYSVTFNMEPAGGTGITTTVTPQLVVT